MSNKDTKMSNKDTKNFERVIREDTRIALQKVNEMKSSWSDFFDNIGGITHEILRKKSEPLSQDQATKIDKAIEKNTGQKLPAKDYSNLPKTQADVPKPEAPKADAPKSDTPDKPTTELPKIDVAGQSKTAMSFKQAFAKARKEAGSSKGQFEYGGKKYQTNFQGTGTKEKPQEKYISMSKQKVTSVKSDAAPASTEPKPAETPKAPEAPKTPETQNAPAPKTEPEIKADVSTAPATPTTTPSATTPKGADGADGASIGGGKGGKGGKGGNTLGECVIIGNNKYRIL
jgi:hypothetical protein